MIDHARAEAMSTRKIVAAAIKRGRMICSMPRPARHGDIIRQMAEAGIEAPIAGEQGFLTNYGHFLGRESALAIAKESGQIVHKHGDQSQLFSRTCGDISPHPHQPAHRCLRHLPF